MTHAAVGARLSSALSTSARHNASTSTITTLRTSSSAALTTSAMSAQRADPYVVGRGLRLDHQTASPNAAIAAVTPRRPAAAPVGAKTAGVWLSNVNHHGKSLQGA